MKRLIHCIDCSALYALTPFDTAPEYRCSGFAGEISQSEKNDVAYSESLHGNHLQEELLILDPALYSDGAYFDPCRVTYLTATNGKETFLIKKWRETVSGPVCYEQVHGRLAIKRTSSIQEDALRRQLFYEIRNPALAEDTVRAFINIFREQALQYSPEQTPAEICPSNYAHIFFKPLTEEQIAKLLSRCRNVFQQEVWERLVAFVMNNCQENGVLSVVIRKTARLVSMPYPLRVKKWFQQIFSQRHLLEGA
jgi:hypothetical protein